MLFMSKKSIPGQFVTYEVLQKGSSHQVISTKGDARGKSD